MQEHEEISGSFACQTKNCYNVNTRALYNEDEQTLFWKCQDGHLSVCEDVRL